MKAAFLSTAFSILVIFFCLTPAAHGQVAFNTTNFNGPSIPVDIFVADMDQDSFPDLLVASGGAHTVTFFRNQRNGTFGNGTNLTTGGVGVNAVAADDIYSPGLPDIITANCGNSPDAGSTVIPSSVSVFRAVGEGFFNGAVNYNLPHCPNAMGTITVVNTTLRSVIVSDGTSTITLLKNDGSGHLTAQSVSGPSGSQFFGISAADYDGDGPEDIAAVMRVSGQPDQVVVFFQNWDGSFFGPVSVFSMSGVRLLAANTVDLNNDGAADLLVPFENGASGPAGVVALTNDTTGNFQPVTLNVDNAYNDIGHKAAEGDLDGSGFHSIVLPVAVLGPGAFFTAYAVFPQSGQGNWLDPIYVNADSWGGHGTAEAAALGDFNRDGQLDISGADGEDNQVFVFTNATTTQTCAVPQGQGGVNICSPANGGVSGSPARIAAAANGGINPISGMIAYIDDQQVASSDSFTLNAVVSDSPGTHTLVVNAWDIFGNLFQSTVTFQSQ
ncbi:MAG TPA: FG-GAP-like repeat-containing protein [Candidatus Angelobacter sp.]